MKHFDTWEDTHPIERFVLVTVDGTLYIYECSTCFALVSDYEGHDKWHEDQM